MSRFSNLNWEALALGSLEDRYWVNIAAGGIILFTAFVIGDVNLTILILLGFYILLAPRTIYLALQGNYILLKEIKELGMSPEDEWEARRVAAARQGRIGLRGVLAGRLGLYYLGLGFSVLSRASTLGEYPVDFLRIIQVIFVMLIIDVLSLTITLLIALVRGNKKNILYPEGVSTELAAETLAVCEHENEA